MLTHPHETTTLVLHKFVVDLVVDISSMNDFEKLVLHKRDFVLAAEFCDN